MVGCIPTKAFLHAADVWEHFLHPEEDGIHCDNPRLDFPMVLDRKNKIVAKHAKGVEFLMKKNKVDWIKGYGSLAGLRARSKWMPMAETDPGSQETSCWPPDRKRACCPGLKPDARRILTNIEILSLSEVPKSLAIFGAGAVGVEFASVLLPFRK